MTNKTFVYPCSLGFFYVTVKDGRIIGLDISSHCNMIKCAISDPKLVDQDIYNAMQPIIDNNDFEAYLKSGYQVAQVGTPFANKVWEQISKINFGETKTYQEIADAIGSPKAVRAVGSACGKNKLAIFVPCHRVVGTGRNKFSYRWGSDLKQILLERESK